MEQLQCCTSISAGASQLKRTAPQWQPPRWVTSAVTGGVPLGGYELRSTTRASRISPWRAAGVSRRMARHAGRALERAMGFEPTTPTLARLCSTPELRPPAPCPVRRDSTPSACPHKSQSRWQISDRKGCAGRAHPSVPSKWRLTLALGKGTSGADRGRRVARASRLGSDGGFSAGRSAAAPPVKEQILRHAIGPRYAAGCHPGALASLSREDSQGAA